jgi:hypothetical protein
MTLEDAPGVVRMEQRSKWPIWSRIEGFSRFERFVQLKKWFVDGPLS